MNTMNKETAKPQIEYYINQVKNNVASLQRMLQAMEEGLGKDNLVVTAYKASEISRVSAYTHQKATELKRVSENCRDLEEAWTALLENNK